MIDRSKFTPNGEHPDAPVPCGENRTVPTEQMALMLAARLDTAGKVLEIGTGSGYQTAVLAEMCQEVVTIEAGTLDRRLQEKLPANVTLLKGDGCTLDTTEFFDGILVTFAAEAIAPVWVKQLRQLGRLVVPLKLGSCCRVCVYKKQGNEVELLEVVAYAKFTENIVPASL